MSLPPLMSISRRFLRSSISYAVFCLKKKNASREVTDGGGMTKSKGMTWAALMLLQTAVVARAQHSARPLITRSVKSERVRDEKLEEAIRRTFPEYPRTAEGEIDYYYNRVDLDGDGKPEVLVFLFGPHVCGTGGCGVLVFK